MKNSHRKILLVEDDKILRLTVLRQLERLNCQALALVNGAEAVNALETGEYDLVLMDVQMPVVSGLEATEAIRIWEKQGKRKRVPIVAVTANPNRKQCYSAGMDDFLFKPYSLHDLQNLIEKWVPDTLSA